MKSLAHDWGYRIPMEDLAEFQALPDKERARVRLLLPLLLAVVSSCFQTSQAIRLIARREGMSASTLQRAWSRYTKAGDWRSLIDGRSRSWKAKS
jgi:hypothetical protein